MTNVPYYLKPTVTGSESTSAIDIIGATEFKYDYDYGYLPEPMGTKGLWEEIAETTSVAANRASDMVWDTAKGTWETAKAGVVGAIQEVRDVGTSLTEGATNIFDSLLLRIIIIFAVLVGAIYLLAKSGALRDVVAILK